MIRKEKGSIFTRTIALVTLWIFLCSNVSFALRPQSAKDRIPAAATTFFALPMERARHVAQNFRSDIETRGTSGSSLSDIVTPLSVPTGNERGSYLFIDLGGTNLRVGLVEFKGNRTYQKKDELGVPVPESVRSGGGEALFDLIAETIHEFVDKHGLSGEVKIGFTFSFAMRKEGLNRGIITPECNVKGYNFDRLIGQDVVTILNQALSAVSLPNIQVVALVNDTEGVRDTGAYRNGKTIAGGVFGTGHNTAIRDSEGRSVNLEAGAFDKLTSDEDSAEVRELDAEIDNLSVNPGVHPLEKRLSGKYVGPLVGLKIEREIRNGNLFANHKGLLPVVFTKHNYESDGYRGFTGKHVTEIERRWKAGGAGVVREYIRDLGIQNPTDGDAQRIRDIARDIMLRSAQLGAATFAGIIMEREHTERPVGEYAYAVEGALLRYPGYIEMMKEALAGIFGKDYASRLDVFEAEDGAGVGAAVTAMIASTQAAAPAAAAQQVVTGGAGQTELRFGLTPVHRLSAAPVNIQPLYQAAHDWALANSNSVAESTLTDLIKQGNNPFYVTGVNIVPVQDSPGYFKVKSQLGQLSAPDDLLNRKELIESAQGEFDALRKAIEAEFGECSGLAWFGMGGSATFAKMAASAGFFKEGRRLRVLDTTDPAAFEQVLVELAGVAPKQSNEDNQQFRKRLADGIRRTGILWVAMALGMTSEEPVINLAAVLELLKEYDVLPADGSTVRVLTLLNSSLHQYAASQGLDTARQVYQFDGKETIPGRGSSPAIGKILWTIMMAGMPLEDWLEKARLSGQEKEAFWNLAIAIDEAARSGRNRVTVIVPEKLRPVLETMKQLFEESEGLNGKDASNRLYETATGAKPSRLQLHLVTGEELDEQYYKPAGDGDDRAFLIISASDALLSKQQGDFVENTLKGRSVTQLYLRSTADLPALLQGFHETVAYLYGYLWHRNYVTQPGVENYKAIAKKMIIEAMVSGGFIASTEAATDPSVYFSALIKWAQRDNQQNGAIESSQIYHSALGTSWAVFGEEERQIRVFSNAAGLAGGDISSAISAAVRREFEQRGEGLRIADVELSYGGDMTHTDDGRDMRDLLEAVRRRISSEFRAPVDVNEIPSHNHFGHEEKVNTRGVSVIVMPRQYAEASATTYWPDYIRAQVLATKKALEEAGRTVILVEIERNDSASRQALGKALSVAPANEPSSAATVITAEIDAAILQKVWDECEIPAPCRAALLQILRSYVAGEPADITIQRQRLNGGLQARLGDRIFALRQDDKVIVREQKFDALVTGSAMFDLVVPLGDHPMPAWPTMEDLNFARPGQIEEELGKLPPALTKGVKRTPGGPGQAEAIVMSILGARVKAVFTLGDDKYADELKARMEASGVDTSGVKKIEGKPTAMTFVPSGTAMIDGNPKPVTAFGHEIGADEALDRGYFSDEDYKVRVFHVGGPALTPKFMKNDLLYVLKRAKREGAITVMDTVVDKYEGGLWRQLEESGAADEICRNLDVLTISKKEIAQYTDLTNPEDIVRHFLSKGVKTVIYKMGDNGCMVGSLDNPIFTDTPVREGRPAPLRMPVYKYPKGFKLETTGMGDAFAAGIGVAAINNEDLGTAVAYATATASRAGERIGGGDLGPEGAQGVIARLAELRRQTDVQAAIGRINKGVSPFKPEDNAKFKMLIGDLKNLIEHGASPADKAAKKAEINSIFAAAGVRCYLLSYQDDRSIAALLTYLEFDLWDPAVVNTMADLALYNTNEQAAFNIITNRLKQLGKARLYSEAVAQARDILAGVKTAHAWRVPANQPAAAAQVLTMADFKGVTLCHPGGIDLEKHPLSDELLQALAAVINNQAVQVAVADYITTFGMIYDEFEMRLTAAIGPIAADVLSKGGVQYEEIVNAIGTVAINKRVTYMAPTKTETLSRSTAAPVPVPISIPYPAPELLGAV